MNPLGWKKSKGMFLLMIAVVALAGAALVIYDREPATRPLGEEEAIELVRKCVAEHRWVGER
jgi:hypothetical protein